MSGVGQRTRFRVPVWLAALGLLAVLGVSVANPWRPPDIELVAAWGTGSAAIHWSVGVGAAVSGHDVTGRGGRWVQPTTGAPGDLVTLAVKPSHPGAAARAAVYWQGDLIAEVPAGGALQPGGVFVSVVIPGA